MTEGERGLEMKKTLYTEEQIIGVLKQMEAGRKVADLARELGVSEATIYTWKSNHSWQWLRSRDRAAQSGLPSDAIPRRLRRVVDTFAGRVAVPHRPTGPAP